jgi:hypothetical protein
VYRDDANPDLVIAIASGAASYEDAASPLATSH